MRATSIVRAAGGSPSASFRNRAPRLARRSVAPATLPRCKHSLSHVTRWSRDSGTGSARDRETSRQQPQPASDSRPGADLAAVQAIARGQLDTLLAREAEAALLRQQLDEQRRQREVAEQLGSMAEQVDKQRDVIAGLLAGLPPKEMETAASQDGLSRLHLASLDGDTQTVKALLDAGASADATSWPGGDTPLHLVAREGHVGVVEALLSAGASTESMDEAGCTPLMTAAHHGQLDVVKALLAAGADKNATSKAGWGAVHMAWMEGHSEVSRLLED